MVATAGPEGHLEMNAMKTRPPVQRPQGDLALSFDYDDEPFMYRVRKDGRVLRLQ